MYNSTFTKSLKPGEVSVAYLAVVCMH